MVVRGQARLECLLPQLTFLLRLNVLTLLLEPLLFERRHSRLVFRKDSCVVLSGRHERRARPRERAPVRGPLERVRVGRNLGAGHELEHLLVGLLLFFQRDLRHARQQRPALRPGRLGVGGFLARVQELAYVRVEVLRLEFVRLHPGQLCVPVHEEGLPRDVVARQPGRAPKRYHVVRTHLVLPRHGRH